MRRLSTIRRNRLPPTIECLEARNLLAAGDLDPTFGVAGLVATDFLNHRDQAQGAAIQPNGRIVVVGSSGPSNGITNFAVARYNADGTLDDGSAADTTPGDSFGSFSTSGYVDTDLGPGFDAANDVVIQPNGKIVAAGRSATVAGIVEFAVVRYNADGSLDDGTAADTTPGDQFGTAGGHVRTDFGFIVSEGTAVALDRNGKIVVAGTVRLNNQSEFGFGLARYNVDGSLDNSFGTAGKVTTTFGTTTIAQATDAVIQPDGKIVVVGFAGAFFSVSFAVARYNADGTLDTSFDGDGRTLVNLGERSHAATAVALEPNGKIVVAGSALTTDHAQDFALVRLNTDGSLDDGGPADATPGDSFGSAGRVITDFVGNDDRAEGVVVQGDGRIVVAGSTQFIDQSIELFHNDFGLVRYNTDGSLDDGGPSDSTPSDEFGVDGKVITDFGGGSPTNDYPRAIVLQPNGNLVVAGVTGDTGVTGDDFAVARYLAGAAQLPLPQDTDGDEIADEIESGAPNGGDANLDGIADKDQAHVASFTNAADGRYVALVAPLGTLLKDVRTRIPGLVHSVTFPIGAFAFELVGAGPDVTTVTLLVPAGVLANSVFKFGPTPNDPFPHWYSFRPNATTGIGPEILPDRIHLHLRDGAEGDDDLALDGKIVDDFAVAVDHADRVGINGVVFHDQNADGVFTGAFQGDIPLAGWTVFLDENQNGSLDEDPSTHLPIEPVQVTSEFGTYSFANLDRRTYTVTEIPPPGWIGRTRFTHRTAHSASVQRSVAAGDFNSDGRLDLVVAHSGYLAVLLARADGTYDAPRTLNTRGFSDSVIVGQFSDDNLPDLAVARGGGFNGIAIYPGSQTGEFDRADPFLYPLAGDGPLPVAKIDIEGDGDDDLVVSSGDHTIAVLRSNRDARGSFVAGPDIEIGGQANALALGHLNPGSGPGQDSLVDAAVSLAGGKIVTVLNIDSASPVIQESTIGEDAVTGALVIGQFNPRVDQHSDIAVIDRASGRVRVLLGDGTGALVPGEGFAAGEDPASLQAADFNSDGVVDLAVANRDSDDVSILAGVGDGSFALVARADVGDVPTALVAADLSGDGLPDLAVATGSGNVSILTRDGKVGQSLKVRLGDNPLVFDANFANQSLFEGRIEGTVFFDRNGNGLRDVGPGGFVEPPIADQHVFLDLNGNGQWDLHEPIAGTNAQGEYGFVHLPPSGANGYLLRLIVSPGLQPTSPPSGVWNVVLQEDQFIERRFGLSRSLAPPSTGEIHGVKWQDLNGNGVRDPDEPGLAGWTIYLDTNRNGQLDAGERSTTTGADGAYAFLDLPAERNYPVAEVVQTNWTQTLPADFQTLDRFPVHDQPVAVTMADFDLDGDRDLAVVNQGSNDISILFNLGDGTFGAETRYAVGSAPVAIVAADLNADNLPDLVVANDASGSVTLLYNSEIFPGVFTPTNRDVGGWQHSVAVGDFNGDHHPDLAVLDVSISLLINDGEGGFPTVSTIAAPARSSSLVAADFNGDDKLDLAVARFRAPAQEEVGGLAVLLGQGNGTFEIPEYFNFGGTRDDVIVSLPTGHTVKAYLKAGDLDGDGDIDLLVPGSGETVEIVDNKAIFRPVDVLFRFINDGKGQFQVVRNEVSQPFTSATMAELSAAPGLEVVLTHEGGLRVLSGEPRDYSVGDSPRAAAVGDLDGDGDLDLVVVNSGSDDVSVLRNRGNGGFDPVATSVHSVLLNAGEIVTGRNFGNARLPKIGGILWDDRDGDSVVDPEEPLLTGGKVYLDVDQDGTLDPDERSDITDLDGAYEFTGLMPGTYVVVEQLPPGWSHPSEGRQAVSVGLEDVARVDFGNFMRIGEIRGNVYDDLDDDGQRMAGEMGLEGWTVFLDLNENGYHDGAEPSTLSDAAGDYVLIGLAPGAYSLGLLMKSGWRPTTTGLLGEALEFSRYASGVLPKTPSAFDLNDDGLLDLVTIVDDHVSFLLQDSQAPGRFLAAVNLPVNGKKPGTLQVADLNGDDLLDLAMGNNELSTISILFNNAAAPGNFLDVVQLPAGLGPRIVGTADLDGDDLLDLVVASGPLTTRTISVLFNNIADPGMFLDAEDMFVGSIIRERVIVDDFNNDERLDLVFGSNAPDAAVVLLNDPADQGSFLTPVQFPVVRHMNQLVARDLNGDTLLDLVAVDPQFNEVSVLLNDTSAPGSFLSSPPIPVGDGPILDVIADLNGDHFLDLATRNQNSGDFSVLFQNPTMAGTFRPAIKLPLGREPAHSLAADLNGDGLLDLVASIIFSDDLSVLLNAGNPTDSFLAAAHYSVNTADLLHVAASDLNGDGLLDLVAQSFSDVSLLLNNRAMPGWFLPAVHFPVGDRPSTPLTIDLNGDGRTDFATTTFGAIYPQTGDFDFVVGLATQSNRLPVHVVTHAAPSVLNFGNQLDADRDGLSDAVEDLAPNRGDGNSDGMPDSQQENVASLPSAIDGSYVTLVSPAGTSLVDVRVSSALPPGAPPAAAFPLGIFDFTLDGVAAGGSASVVMIVHSGGPINAYYKFGGTPGGAPPHWYDFSFNGATGARLPMIGNRLTIELVDGQRGDDDSTPGSIHDPGGPAIVDSGPIEPLFTLSPINGPSVAVPGQLVSYSVAFSDGNPVGSYTTTIDWGDGTVSDGYTSVSSAGGVTDGRVSFWHTYKTLGDRVVRLTLRDSNGNVRTAELPVTVQMVTFQPDPLDATRRSLVVGGFDQANDQIVFQPDGSGVRLLYNGYSVGPFAFDGSIVAFGQGGNDTIRVDQRLTRSAMLFGQDGNDILVGSAGTNVLVGGAGNDQLFGFAARDLLFGGLGADVLNGHGPSPSAGDSDLLCSDYAAGEYDPSLLASLHNRWQSPASYADRLYNLRYAASPALNNTTVFNDFSADRLIGGAGLDWFLFSALDEVVDVEDDEQGLGVVLRPRRR